MLAYFQNRNLGTSCGPGEIIDLSRAFCGLGKVLDWIAPRRDWIFDKSAEFDTQLAAKVDEFHKQKRTPHRDSFDPARPVTFALVNLVKVLVEESSNVQKGDGMDLFHAVMGSSFASYAALDKR